jgi:hypothetical protein
MYFPKSQIETNLYTYGEELELSPWESLCRTLLETSNGKYYTGKTLMMGFIRKLFPLPISTYRKFSSKYFNNLRL